jgi:hypothetical protein
MRTVRFIPTSLTVLLVLGAKADFMQILQPNAAYLSSTQLLEITQPDFTAISSLTKGGDSVSFDVDLAALTVPTTWSSWGSPPSTEGSTPRVLWTNGFTSLTITSPKPLSLLGFEAQPNTSVVSPITASFFSGAVLVGEFTIDVDGSGGARLFAASSTTSFDSVVVSSSDDFAIAQLRVQNGQAIPAPSASVLSLMGIGLIGAYGGVRRTRKNHAHG